MPLDVQIRWLIRRDMPEVLSIERGCFEFPWNEDEYLVCLRQRNCIGMVAEHKQKVVGIMVYELRKSRLHILTMAVKPVLQRHGIGRQMIERLIRQLRAQRRQEIWAEVRERNVAAQGFFKEMGFVARNILHGHYDETNEDCYQFRFSLTADELDAVYGRTVNRVWKFVERLRSHADEDEEDDVEPDVGGEGGGHA